MQEQENHYSDGYQQIEEVDDNGREVVFRSSFTMDTDQIAQMNDNAGSGGEEMGVS